MGRFIYKRCAHNDRGIIGIVERGLRQSCKYVANSKRRFRALNNVTHGDVLRQPWWHTLRTIKYKIKWGIQREEERKREGEREPVASRMSAIISARLPPRVARRNYCWLLTRGIGVARKHRPGTDTWNTVVGRKCMPRHRHAAAIQSASRQIYSKANCRTSRSHRQHEIGRDSRAITRAVRIAFGSSRGYWRRVQLLLFFPWKWKFASNLVQSTDGPSRALRWRI